MQSGVRGHAALLAVLCALSFLGLDRSLWTPDEPREAEISRQMWLAPGVVPSLNGRPFIEKPPLYYWSAAAAYALTGAATPAAARSVSAVAGALTLLLVYFWGRRACSPQVGLIACAGLATSLRFAVSTHWVLIDPLLMLLTTAAAWSAWVLIDGGNRARHVALLYGSLGLALWVKGLIGPLLLGAGFVAFAVVERRLASWRSLYSTAGLAVFLAALGLLALAIDFDGGRAALREWFWVNHVERFVAPQRTGHEKPLPYYLWNLPLAVLPWLPALLDSLRPSRWRGADPRLRVKRYWGALVVGMLVLLSASATKRDIYLLPLLPMLALLLAANMHAWWVEQSAAAVPIRSPEWWLQCLLCAVFALAPVGGTLWRLGSRDPVALTYLVAAGGMALFLAWQSTRGARHPLALALLALAAAGVVGLVFVMPRALEPQKNMMPFVRWVGTQLPAREPVYATGVDETLEGIVPFVTGRRLVEIELARLRGAAPAFVLVQGSQGGRTAPDLGKDYRLLGERHFGPGRYMALWRRKEAGPP